MDELTSDDDRFQYLSEVMETLELAIRSADPETRKDLAKTIGEYKERYPQDFHEREGQRSISLFSQLLLTIVNSVAELIPPRPNIDSEPEGSA
jgi:hypothetical protein